MTRKEKAMEIFSKGYNCSQSVLCAFQDVVGMDEDTILKLAQPFGSGIGKQREVCGAVSGMAMAIGLMYGTTDPSAENRGMVYQKTSEVCEEFRKENGSIICAELLGLRPIPGDTMPGERTQEYYQKRPCRELVGMAAEILEKYIEEHK